MNTIREIAEAVKALATFAFIAILGLALVMNDANMAEITIR